MSGVRSSWDMLAMNSDLYFEETRQLAGLLLDEPLGLLDLLVLLLGLDVPLGEQARLPAEVLVGLAQLLLLRAELLGLRLGLLEQVLGEGVGFDGVEDEADALGQLVEERLVGRAERGEGGQLDHGPHRPLEQDRQDDDVERGEAPRPELIRT